MAKSGRGRAPRDRKRPYVFRAPEPPCTPKPPRVPPPPTPPGPGDHLWPDPLERLKKALARDKKKR